MMPLPAHATADDRKEIAIDGGFTVRLAGFKDPRLERAQARFLHTLSAVTGIPLGFKPVSETLTVVTQSPGAPVLKLGEDESYTLEVLPGSATLTAATPLGAMHGLETFLQLVHLGPSGFAVQAVRIDDRPRFPWRGLMLDSSRHFMPVPVIEQMLDGMAAVKLNVFHWHLSDDQGFRVESKRYPRLTEFGSDGLYYTQEEVRAVIEYARDRGIRVVPEFDVPAHTTAWFAGYPALASGRGPYTVARRWGVLDAAMDPTKGSTYVFLDTLIGEMSHLFPDAYFHIGGDECNGKEWDRNPAITRFKLDHHLVDNAALQTYFTGRVQQLVAKHGKIAEGWDEVLQPGTPKSVLIQSWRGQASLAQAARSGYQGILSSGYYLDLNQTAAEHYLVDPVDPREDLSPEQADRILGGEAAMWTEYVTAENVNSRLWPRAAAVAERLWSAADVRDVDSMYARLTLIAERLKCAGIDNGAVEQTMLDRIAGGTPEQTGALRILAEAVAPQQGYARGQLGVYDSTTPLNRLVDAVPPESEAARLFLNAVDSLLAGEISTEERHSRAAEVQAALIRWRDNDAQLKPVLERSALAAELAPISESVGQVAAIGLEALATLDGGSRPSQNQVQNMLSALDDAELPRSVLRNRIVPGVRRLVEAAGQ